MSNVVVTDATVLIYLARLGKLRYLAELFERAFVPDAVFQKTVAVGRQEQYADSLPIEEACDEFLTIRPSSGAVEDLASDIEDVSGLGRGECEAIALARIEDARCLTDDHAARKTAQSLGVEVGGTIYVLLLALETYQLSFEEYVDALDFLTENGFRMSASLYRRAVSGGKELVD